MKLFAFDLRDNGNWRKKWGSLAAEFTVYACNMVEERTRGMDAIDATKRNQKALVLIHQEPCGERVNITGWKNVNPTGLYVMYVHGNGCSPMGTEQNWIYAAKRPVPTNTDLAYLSKEFASLCENLEKAVSEQEVSGAWRAFDRNPLAELLEVQSSINMTSSATPELGPYLGRVFERKDEAWRKYAAAEINRILKGTAGGNGGENLANTLLHGSGEAIVDQMREEIRLVLYLARRNL